MRAIVAPNVGQPALHDVLAVWKLMRDPTTATIEDVARVGQPVYT